MQERLYPILWQRFFLPWKWTVQHHHLAPAQRYILCLNGIALSSAKTFKESSHKVEISGREGYLVDEVLG